MPLSTLSADFRPGLFSQDPDVLEKYGQDWSGVVRPNAGMVAFPRTTEEVASILKRCHSESIPVVPSGGRTGLSGGAIAAKGELVLSLEKMNRIGKIDLLARTLEVEAGAVTEAVHRFCEPHGLTWPVDFASKGSSQVGGNLSTNAGGVRVVRYGLTRNWVLGVTAVTMDGTILRLNGALEKNNTGIDLRQAFIGSEGTLGVVTEAILKLAPVPVEERTRVCFFSVKDFARLIDLFASARRASFTLSAFECLSRRCLEQVVKFGLKAPFAVDHDAYALIEFEERVAGEGDAWIESVFSDGLVQDGVQAQSPREKKELWALREQVAESILHGNEVHQQDLSVPIANLEPFAKGIEERYRAAYPEFPVFIFGHIGDGNLHVFIQKPAGLSGEKFHEACEAQDRMLFELTQKFHGSVSAEHGIGILKKPALPYSRSAGELELLRSLKQVFDPKGLLNPGKILN